MPEEFSLGNYVFDLSLTVFGYFIMYFVTIKIAAERNWARWLLLVGFLLYLLGIICNMRVILSGDAISGIEILSQVLVTGLAAALLFQRPSSVWFTGDENAEKNSVIEKIRGQFKQLKEDETEGTWPDDTRHIWEK